MEASSVHAPAALTGQRLTIGPRLLRLRSDEQLVALFRSGHDEAFQVIWDRYHKRLLAYARQMLPRGNGAEDALQDVFMRAYWALRDNRQLALKAWLFRVAHNRCVDELRRPSPPPPELLALSGPRAIDPATETDTRESLRRLITDIHRLPDQQRSALLMRELGGMSYCEVADALGTSVPAIKSLLVRARMALIRAGEARDTACTEIREELVLANDQGQRAGALARRHLRDCADCRTYRQELRGVRRNLAALLPVGPFALWSKLLGGGSASGGTGGGSAILAGTGGATGGAGAMVGAKGVAAIIAAAIATTGGAVGLQHVLASPAHPHVGASSHRAHGTARSSAASSTGYGTQTRSAGAISTQAGNPNYASIHRAASSLSARSGHTGALAASPRTSGTLVSAPGGSGPAPTSVVRQDGSPSPTGSVGGSGAPTGAAGTTTGLPTTGSTGSGSTTGSTSGSDGTTSTGSTGTSQGSTTPTGAGGTAGAGTTTPPTTGGGQATGGSGSGTSDGSSGATDTGSSGSSSGVTGAGSTT